MFRGGFPFDIYKIQYKFVLTFPALRVFLFCVLFPSQQESAELYAGRVYGAAGGSGGSGRVEQREEGKKRPTEERTLEAKGSCQNGLGSKSLPLVVCHGLLFSVS